MLIATWNINGVKSRIDQVLAWCSQARPDVLCLQETKIVDAKFPARRFHAIGYEYTAFLGESAYNGVAIVSRLPLEDIEYNFPDDPADAPKRLIAATIEGVRVVNVYSPHGTAFGTDRFKFKLDWIARLRSYFDRNFSTEDDVVLLGDLNVAAHELDVWNPSLWKDKMHFSKPEREALMELKRWGFIDLFRHINGAEREYTWWSVFHTDFEKDRGLRIDHIWTSPALAEACTDCWIDKRPRALEKPSDHAPVMAELRLD